MNIFIFLINLILVSFLSGCFSGLNIKENTNSNDISAAWFYLSDDTNYESIPSYWKDIHFDKVNRLYVGPLGIQDSYNFNLYKGIHGDLSMRFKWLIQKAKADNPNIEIIASQWWGDSPNVYGYSLDALNKSADEEMYAQSVVDFIESYQVNDNGKYAINGYDIDYEDDNVIPDIKNLLNNIRNKLDKLSLKNHKKYYFTITPASTNYINESSILSKIDNINMQSYAGGSDIQIDFYLNYGVDPKRIFYGICPETNCKNSKSVESVLAIYKNYKLGGIHLYRLNSDNYLYENSVQENIFSILN
jgi:hypothetical protein